MGSYLSSQNSGIEELDIAPHSAYTFPPKSGSYFGNYFFMGGKKFDSVQPEAYLFGDNEDLNYLGPHPYSFPYQSPSGNQPVRALKCLVNIRKDSLRLIRVPNPPNKPDNIIIKPDEEPQDSTGGTGNKSLLYNLEFTFDADCPCSITVYYNAAEEMRSKAVIFTSKSVDQQSDTVHYNAGCNQQFCVTSHVINPSLLYKENSGIFNPNQVPIAIQVRAECGPDFAGHSHVAYANFEKGSDETWNIKLTKQKQAINGVCYIFQEIYGIENKNSNNEEDGDAGCPDTGVDEEDNSECVVCLSDARDTLILPCKHLCLCSSCANQLRFQQSGCPICRQSFRALLQIRAVRKKSPLSQSNDSQVIPEEAEDDRSVDAAGSQNEEAPLDVNVPPGYEVIPLISAINGPVTSVSLASLSIGEGNRAASTLSSVSSTSSLQRSSRKKKKGKVTMDIENEMTPPGDGGSDSIDRRKSRGKRRKKLADEAQQQTSVDTMQDISSTIMQPESESGPLAVVLGSYKHTYENEVVQELVMDEVESNAQVYEEIKDAVESHNNSADSNDIIPDGSLQDLKPQESSTLVSPGEEPPDARLNEKA